MKSRSNHRLPTMEPPDDWVNGSWTVDCVCGVNFDDGEEMVNCDECGVWVHTRCSRYVKGEKSFACDKCKNRNYRNSECEETEVAQLLVELPTKTLRMDNQNSYPPLRPFKLWTHRPMEERVHVQGVPGGEPSLFGGVSSILTPELWKCSGHVPKKFNFHYKEFPCWDDEEDVNGKTEEENENPVDKGAGVLFSLSNNVMATPVATLFGTKGRVNEGESERLPAPEDRKKGVDWNMCVRPRQRDVEKDGPLLRPFVIHSSKRKKEDLEIAKDIFAKKKVRLVHGGGFPKKRMMETSTTDSTTPSDAKQFGFNEAKGPKIVNTDTQVAKSSDADTVVSGPLSGDLDIVKNSVDKSNDKLASSEKPQENNTFDVSRHSLSIGAKPAQEKGSHQNDFRCMDPSNTADGIKSSIEHNVPGTVGSNEEVVGSGSDNVNGGGRDLSTSAANETRKSESILEKPNTLVSRGIDNKACLERPSNHDDNVKTELNVDSIAIVETTIQSDAKMEVTKTLVEHVESSTDPLSANLKTDNKDVISSQTTHLKGEGDEASREATDKFPSNFSEHIRQVVISDCSTSAGNNSTDLKVNSRVNGHSSKISRKNAIPEASSAHHKVTAPSSASATIPTSKPSISDNRRPPDSKNHNSVMKTGLSDSNSNTKKDKDRHEMRRDSSMKRDKERHDLPRNILKERVKSPVGSISKASHFGKIPQAPEAKKTSSDPKYSSGTGVTSGLVEPSSSLQAPNMSNLESKISASGSSLRGEKVNSSNSQSSNKINHSAPVHPPAPSNSPAILSDEELALLLHQELNSSPRVPRVPRMRNSGSLPQLGSPTSTTSLIKRTSSSGGRDQNLVARRKGKDPPKEGSHGSRDIDDETKESLLLSPDLRNDKQARVSDAVTVSQRKADGSGKGIHGVKRSAAPLSSMTPTTRPFSPSDARLQKSGSSRYPARSTSDDDAGTIKGPTHQTLPGLLAEIMREGKRMTYEELCNAVLPHWPNLRKHNGERYAYSSHSQAVLDCLRNRLEWAQLVDRGPKTNGGRKKRKLGRDSSSNESEDEENGKAKEVESRSIDSHREDFPRGKRKARKRRRLALQGRHVKDVRRRRKAEVVSDDENGSSTSSSEDSIYSDDELQGNDETCLGGSEAGTSSDEAGD